jgi:hypothetical protein
MKIAEETEKRVSHSYRRHPVSNDVCRCQAIFADASPLASSVLKKRHFALAGRFLRIRPKPCVLSISQWTQAGDEAAPNPRVQRRKTPALTRERKLNHAHPDLYPKQF